MTIGGNVIAYDINNDSLSVHNVIISKIVRYMIKLCHEILVKPADM